MQLLPARPWLAIAMTVFGLCVPVALIGAEVEKEPLPNLIVGSSAPKLETKKFLKGDPITEFAPDKTYVVELWATWCGPCIASIPHLSQLQQDYPDVTFIGVAVAEENQAHVVKWVKEHEEKFGYRVALDDAEDGEGKTWSNWLQAADRKGIPCSFVVHQGKIASISHPMELDRTLEQISKGEFDIAVAAKDYEDKLVRARRKQRYEALAQAAMRKRLTVALDDLDELDTEYPEFKLQGQLCRLQLLTSPRGDLDRAEKLVKQILAEDVVDAYALHSLGTILVRQSQGRSQTALPKLALAVAKRAEDIDAQNPNNLLLLAHAYGCNQQYAEACQTTDRLIELVNATFNGGQKEAALKQLREVRESFQQLGEKEAAKAEGGDEAPSEPKSKDKPAGSAK